jgi:hypothetical protein
MYVGISIFVLFIGLIHMVVFASLFKFWSCICAYIMIKKIANINQMVC